LCFETARLHYAEITGLVWTRETEDDDSVCLGRPGDWRSCPDEFAEEMDQLIGLIEDAERYGAACVATAREAYERG
jgi:hypothetical protein